MNKNCTVLSGIFLLSAAFTSTPLLANTPDGFTDDQWSSIQSVIEADRYRAFAVAGESAASGRIEAYNPAQHLHALFDSSGLKLTPQSATGVPWALEMQLTSWGRKGQPVSLDAVTPVLGDHPDGQRIEYRHAALTEWFINDERGLEQGFTITQRPAGDSGTPLRLELTLDGDLRAELMEQGEGLALYDREGMERVRYAGLLAWDANGRDLPLSLTRTEQGLALEVSDRNAQYPLTVDPTFTEVAKLTASDAAGGDQFGWSVSLFGDTALVGANGDDGFTGSAYVFTRSGTTWTEQQKLTASDAAGSDQFGVSVSLSGDTALIGAYIDDSSTGAAYVFTRSGTTWTEQQKLTASDAAAGDYFGYSVSLSGDTALVGAWGDDGNTGAAYVFTRSGTTWTEQQKLTASDGAGGEAFGYSVSLSGDTALIGARGDDGATGSAYVFTRSGTTWTEQQKLSASDGAASDFFGESVSLSGDTALIGAHSDDGSTGAAYVFTRSGTTWAEQQKLTASDGVASDYFGISVSLSGATALVGAYADDGFTGSAYVFTRSGTTWTEQQKLTASDAVGGEGFGISVSLSGNTALIGAYGDGNAAGSAYMFSVRQPHPPANHSVPALPPWTLALLILAILTAEIWRRRIFLR